MKRTSSQSGQATTEMVFMLLGFAVLLLGIIFTLSLEIFNTGVLIDSKYETERSVNFENASLHGGAGRELKGWDYDNGIPFTLKDQPLYHSGGEVTEAWEALSSDAASGAAGYTYEWRPLKEFTKGEFKADYKESTQSAISAANLITRQGEHEGRRLTAKLPELYSALANLLGVKINYDNLTNNPSNRVYLPANGEL
jgi:hypothetical protein